MPVGLLDDDVVSNRDSLLAAMAISLFLSQIGIEIVPQRLLEETEEMNARDIKLEPLASLVTKSRTSSSPFGDVRGEAATVGDDAQPQDMAIARLQRYTSVGKPPAPRQRTHGIISHWVTGSDPWEYQWAMPTKQNEIKEELEQKRLKQEAQRRARAERLGLPVHLVDEVGTASQPTPRIAHSSQLQTASSQQVMSQTLGGPHGARPKPLKKVKKTSGFR